MHKCLHFTPPLNIKKKTQKNLVTKSSHANDIVKMVTDFVESEFLAMGDRRLGDRRRKIRLVSLEGRRRNVAVFELSGRAQFASWRGDGISAKADAASAPDAW
jgi:hypothetical protein